MNVKEARRKPGGQSRSMEFHRFPLSPAVSSDPESHLKVGFESVSGFGFRVSSIETNFRCRFRVSGFRVSSLETNFRCRFRVSGFVDCNQLSLSVSGFGFRRLKPTFAVGFGFRVSSIETNFRCRVSGFGFRRLKPTFAVGFGFRVSSIAQPTFAVGFGFRVSSIETNFRWRFRVSGFVA